MGKFGLRIAKWFGRKLPAFENQAEAEAHYFTERDVRIETPVLFQLVVLFHQEAREDFW